MGRLNAPVVSGLTEAQAQHLASRVLTKMLAGDTPTLVALRAQLVQVPKLSITDLNEAGFFVTFPANSGQSEHRAGNLTTAISNVAIASEPPSSVLAGVVLFIRHGELVLLDVFSFGQRPLNDISESPFHLMSA